MVRFTNFNRAPYANFWHEHPEFYAQMLASTQDPKTGVRTPIEPHKRQPYSRVMSFAYPEVRTFYVSFFKQLASTGTKGIMIDMLRHPPIAGYEPIVTATVLSLGLRSMSLFMRSIPAVAGFLSTVTVKLEFSLSMRRRSSKSSSPFSSSSRCR